LLNLQNVERLTSVANKKQPLDLMKFVPLGVLAVSAISGYTMLNARVSSAEDKIKSYEVAQTKLTEDSADIRVSQAKSEAKIDSIHELLKDIKGKL